MRTRRRFGVAVLGLAALALLVGGEAHAGLIGTSTTGDLQFSGTGSTNWFDPANGHVPSGYLNNTQFPNITISGTAVEFGYQDGANLDTADFSNTGLTLGDVSSLGSDAATYTFTDTAFSGATLAKLTDTFPGGVTAGISGDTLTIQTPAFAPSGTFNATFSITPAATAAVPEPSTLALLALGGGALAGWRRWRRRKATA
jgi:hypothetical protein